MLNEKFTFSLKITIKWSLTKTHATTLKLTTYKAHVIKKCILKGTSYSHINQPYDLHMMKFCFLVIKKFKR